jgi:hypothetical protein
MSDLKIKSPVAESRTALYAFSASYAELLIYIVFVKRFFNELPFDSICRTCLIFGTGGQIILAGSKVPETEFAVTAYPVSVNTFYRRRVYDAIRSASSALNAFIGIYLPAELFFSRFRFSQCAGETADTKERYPLFYE